MINFNDYTNENKTEHNKKCLISIQNINNKRFWIRKNKFIIKFNKQLKFDKIYLFAKDPYGTKYQYLVEKLEKVGLKHYDDPKAFIEYSNDMQSVKY